MHVDKPSNVDNSDIGSRPDYAQPLSIPTDMSYVHCWYSIAELSRLVTDTMSSAGCETDEMPYDMLLELDGKFKDYLNSLPTFFRLDPKSQEETRHLHEQRSMLEYHRQMANMLVHTRLYRLHRPYLVAGSRNPCYSYSRVVCLRSARLMLETGKKIATNWGPTSTKLWTFIHHYLVATLVLIVDYCLNKEEARASERKQEILDCFRTLDGCQDHSAIARRGLQQLKNLLVQGVSLDAHSRGADQEPADSWNKSQSIQHNILANASHIPKATESAATFESFLPATCTTASTMMPSSTSFQQIDQLPSADFSFENIDLDNFNFNFGAGTENQEFADLFAAFENNNALY